MSRNRLIYVMDPMCSWCWGFAPVAQALIAVSYTHLTLPTSDLV